MTAAEQLKPAMPEYHQSGLGMYLKCQKQYFYRYIMGLRMPPKSALTLGGAVDSGVTLNLQTKLTTKEPAAIGDVLDAYSTEFDRRSTETDWDGDDAGEQKDAGVKLVELHYEKVAPNLEPATVQEAFRIETDAGYAIGGTLDLTTTDGMIRDTKTSAKAYDEDAVSMSIQAAMYDFAYEVKRGEKAKGFAFDVLKKTKTPAYQEVTGQVSSTQREMLFESISIMHKQIQAGDFLPAPEGGWWCSKKFCGYWPLCKGRK